METDDTRRLHGFVEIAIHRFADMRTKCIKGFRLRMNPVAERRRDETSLGFVFANFKDDLVHWWQRIASRSGVASDGDGIPDAQELLSPFDSAQGARGTDPHDPASVLRLSQLDKTATGMQMQFPTLAGKPSAALRPPGPIASNSPTTSPPISGTPSPNPSPATVTP